MHLSTLQRMLEVERSCLENTRRHHERIAHGAEVIARAEERIRALEFAITTIERSDRGCVFCGRSLSPALPPER